MSTDTTSEIDGFHDRLRRACKASHNGEWDDAAEILSGARSEALKRKAELKQGGDEDG